MRILAIDSSSMVATVAVVTDGVLTAEYTINHKKTHSQTLLPMIDEIKKNIDLDMNTVDAIAIAGGPGSYTGLRIGSATAKGFGLALNIPIINIPTMDALAYNLFSSSFVICPIMDARREQVYTGIYKFNGTTMEVIKPQCIMMIRDLVKELNNMSQAVMFNGDGVDAYKDIIEEEMTTEHYYAPASVNRAKASSLASLAEIYYKEGKTETAAEHAPEYLRLSQAERELKEKMQEIIYRLMSEGDIKQVAAIEKEIFSLPWSEKSFLDSLKNENTVYIVAEIKDEIVAYCGAYISFEEAGISNVAVKKNFRRKNVAENMLNKLFYECGKKGVSDITLEVRETNVPAISLYEKLGFEEAGIRKNFYEKPVENALIMWKHD